MKLGIALVVVLLSLTVAAADPLTDQIDAFKAAQDRNEEAAREAADIEAERVRREEERQQAEARAAQRAQELRRRAAEEKARAENEERLRDKARLQAQEDEEHRLEIELKRARVEEAKALSAAKASRANEILDAQLAREKAKTDVIQSEADATRNVSEGAKELQIGIGKGAEAEGKSWFK